MGFYSRLRDMRNDDEDLQKCIATVVDKLENAQDPRLPGMLLGKIQSGKTRAFLGVVARAFDHGYDIAIILTKGTKALASQTVRRIGRDFKEFIDEDEILLFDIMQTPSSMSRAELNRKIIIVAKKQVNNLDRIQELFDTVYPVLRNKSVLLVDDEADMASVRFAKKRGETQISQGSIATQMDILRRSLKSIRFLQVTATPYALYLQPETYAAAGQPAVYYPKRPAFTELLPIHSAYVGGDDYFGGHGPDDPRYYLYLEVALSELDALRSSDGRVIRADRLWTSDKVQMLRRSIVSFLLAASIRRRQQGDLDQRGEKYAMIIHNDTQRKAHDWQWETVNKLVEIFENAAENDDDRLKKLCAESLQDLKQSVEANGSLMPKNSELYADLKKLLVDGDLTIQRVNSDVQLTPLLDPETAELRLRTKANIFIGGSILDRGITVPNLITFYYGRSPKRMQADTVLQHARMYGARSIDDLAVTRFYTSRGVYSRLVQINALETALREAFESGAHEDGVVFIQSDARNGFIPCAPSKVALSDVIAVRPNGILLPTGFDTISQSKLNKSTKDIDGLVPNSCKDSNKFARVSVDRAVEILHAIEETLELGDESSFEWEAMIGLLRYFAASSDDKVMILAETGRKLDKKASGDRSGLSILGTAELRGLVQQTSRKEPAIILLRQEGGDKLGWKAGPFWWPMLASPPQAKACVFATKLPA